MRRWCSAGSRASRWPRTASSSSRCRKAPSCSTPPAFVEPPRLRAFAAVATWGGLILEALIALLCLIPAGGRIELARHASLLAFCVTTYALAPVAGFGWLLATMGLAQCRPDQRALRGAYVAVFVLILLYSEIPVDRRAGGLDGALTGTAACRASLLQRALAEQVVFRSELDPARVRVGSRS